MPRDFDRDKQFKGDDKLADGWAERRLQERRAEAYAKYLRGKQAPPDAIVEALKERLGVKEISVGAISINEAQAILGFARPVVRRPKPKPTFEEMTATMQGVIDQLRGSGENRLSDEQFEQAKLQFQGEMAELAAAPERERQRALAAAPANRALIKELLREIATGEPSPLVEAALLAGHHRQSIKRGSEVHELKRELFAEYRRLSTSGDSGQQAKANELAELLKPMLGPPTDRGTRTPAQAKKHEMLAEYERLWSTGEYAKASALADILKPSLERIDRGTITPAEAKKRKMLADIQRLDLDGEHAKANELSYERKRALGPRMVSRRGDAIAASAPAAQPKRPEPRSATSPMMPPARRAMPVAAPVQMKATVADSAMSAADVREAAALGTVGSGHALPHLDKLQAAFGRDLSGIKAHTDSSAAAGAAAMGAKAYATGNNVVFGDNPDLHTVAHEVAHVLQQQEGIHLSSGVGAAGDDYERAADAIADRVVAGQSAVDLLPGAQSASPGVTQLQSMLRAGDQPKVSAVSSLLADFPAEREAMMAELRGNVSPKFVASLAKVRSDSGLAAAQQPRPVAAAPIVSTSVAVPIVPAIQSAGIEPDTGRSRAVQKKETTAKATTAATTEGDYGALTLPTAAMTQGQVHSWITTQIGKHGLAKLRLLVQVQQGPTKAKILEEMDSLLPQALSLSKTFRRNADRAAHDLLDASERGIVAALAPYGQFSLEKLRVVGKTIALKGDGMTESLVNGLMNTAQTAQPGAAMRPTDDKAQAPKDPAGQLQQRQALQEAAQELSGLHRRVSQLQQQMMEAGACAPKRESDHERKARSGNVATHALPASASLPQMPGADFAASSGASATAQPPKPADFAAATAQYESAQAQLRTRWQELEQQHPALVAYRAGNGHSLDALGASKDGNQALRHLLHAVVPKLGNIVKTRSGLDNDVNPLTLPSVVALTKQRMGITDGSLRSGLLIDPIADANSAGWKDYAVAAVTVGAMVITAVSTAGTSLLVGAELVGLAASVYGATDALGTFQQQKALSNTDLDRAKSMSLAEPSLFWLAAALVGIPLSAAAAVKVFQQAVRLRRASAAARQLQTEATSSAAAVKQLNAGTETGTDAAQEVKTLTAELDAVGEANGLGKVGQQIANQKIDLAHGTSHANAQSIRAGIKIDANAAHPGRQQWGPGFYLADEIIAKTYAAQTATPTLVSFKNVVLNKLGTVLDCTSGEGLAKWNAFMDSSFAGHTRRYIWKFPESKGVLVEEFLTINKLKPDVIVAPHDPSFQVIVRTQAAADILASFMAKETP